MPDVQQAAAGSQGLANAYEGLWDAISDALLDERPFVVGLAASAVAQLLAWGSGDAAAASTFSGAAGSEDGPSADATAAATAAGGTSAGFMMCRVADRASQRLAAALGPVLEMCSLVPAAGQVAVCDLLLALVQRVLAQVLRAAAGDATALPPPPTGVPVPNLASLVSSAATYLAGLQQAGDAAARTEACGAVLSLAADLAAAGPPAAAAAAGLPAAQVLDAVQALLALREREYMEAGLADMCEVVVAALPALLPPARALVLQRLWPLAARISDVPRRARVFASAWHAAVDAEMETRTAGTTAAAAPLAKPAAPPSVSASSDPMSMLAGLAAGAAAAAASPEAAGLVTEVPASVSVAAVLADPYVEVLLTGKAPAVEANGSFAVAQASATAASTATAGSSFMRSMSRSAPPPPPPLVSPGSLQRSESAMSGGSGAAAGSSIDLAASTGVGKMPPGKGEKEKKGVLGGLFGRNKDKKGKSAADAAAAERAEEQARQEAAAAAAAAAAQKAAAVAAAAAAAAAATPPSPGGAPGPSSASTAAAAEAKAAAAAAAEAAAAASVRSMPHATLRHELLQCLLQQLAHHPAAATAAELAAEAAAAARHDRQPPLHTTAGAGAGGGAPSGSAHRLVVVAQWVAMTTEVLKSSAACVGWEPYVMPAITSQPSVGAAGRAPVDFNSLTGDLWLALLQAAVQASRAAQAILGRLVAEAAEAATAAAAAGASTGPSYGMGYGMGYGTPYGMAPAAGALAGSSLTSYGSAADGAAALETYYRGLLALVDGRAAALQGLITKLLSNWPQLSSAARPRVMWVAAHCMALPGHWDDRWELLLNCLDSLMVRGTDVLAASRRADVMGSALAGSLFKAGRQAWNDPSRPFLFDIASASALCEAPEYEVQGLLSGLAALQHLAARLINVIADAVPHGAAGAAHGQASAVAKRLDALMRHFIGTELAGAPHVRDWVKRIMRQLSTITTYAPPATLPVTVAALGFVAKQAHQADGADGAAAPADDDSSDASSVYQPEETPEGDTPPPPPAVDPTLLAAAAAINASRGAARAMAAEAEEEATAAAAAQQSKSHGAQAAQGKEQQGEGANGVDGAAEGGGAGRPKGGPATHSYLVHSAAAAMPMWGYPFAPLSSVALHNSKRARRQRALAQHLASAAATAQAPRPVVAAALATASPDAATAGAAGLTSPAAGPELSSRTAYKLDTEAFWASLPGTHSPWQELTGPADPLLLRACFVRSAPGQGDPTVVTVMLSAVNRLPMEITDAEVALKTNGPLLSSARRAATWELPRIAPHDRAAASFKFKVLGYGDLSLHARLQLCAGPPRVDPAPLQVHCTPLELPPQLLLRPPPAGLMAGSAAEFYRGWATLPARMELSGVCTWPGAEGGALLLSALLRQPLACAWMQHIPAVCGFQAGFVASTALDDMLSLVVITQLMPPAGPGAAPESFTSLTIRSSSPELIFSIQSGAAAWLNHITAGTAALGPVGRAALPGARPPLHPRVAALLQTYAASAAQLGAAGAAGIGLAGAASNGGALAGPYTSYGIGSTELVGAASGVAAAAAATAAGGTVTGPAGAKGAGGKDVSVAWLKNAALAEWQRLNALSAV
ncbi:hypothetical protein HYH02_003961 [Chlamydomonas schloesseri]|uniref:Uncharacterized protein n=1 Tax=Chlamydomonas schloesseri TaxID=2026947 RepID=A0A836B916_9CHLO|nr:hypothetical protein HYH02_003961 [Chlamydomonas schloesseri]|eukprot:KAG2451357.1 hypothetical protein HYH02_003961 [Chlamydomonas schloesseri]